MEQLSFKLETVRFEGPLDLLLHLISKHKLNINDIPIIALVGQYLAYIESMVEQNMEVAGEFLEMAARLVYIKTLSLLPSRGEAEELKKELEGKLIEYSLCKKAAVLMKNRYIGDIITVRQPLKIDFDNTYSLQHDREALLSAYSLMSAKIPDKPLENKVFSDIVSKKMISVTSKIIYLLRILYKHGQCAVETLFRGMNDRSERVAAFLAVLELTKAGRIALNEDNTVISFNRRHSREQV